MTNIHDGASEIAPPHIAGNWQDDDAAYIDDLVGYDGEPPTPAELPTGKATELHVPAVSPKRIVAFTLSVSTPMAQAIMAMPADTNRERLYITANNTAVLYIADNKSLLPSPSQSAAKFESAYGMAYAITFPAHFVIDGYTGPVWFMADPTANTPQLISFMAVTK